MPVERRKEIWDDEVHFTEKGYDLIGELLAERLVELIQAEGFEVEAQKPLVSEDLKKRDGDVKGSRAVRADGRKLRSGRVLVGELAAG